MAAPRINYLAANFSYAPELTKANYLDALTKFLVSGFGPFNIEKIKVTNKVVRVTTTEKNFYSVPGCKLAIAGTNVAAIDDSHELTEIFIDGFSFALDTPNAEFTNGLTYSVPSLGWTLVRQTAVITIYQSTAALIPFYVIITKRNAGGYTDNRYDQHCIQVCYDLDEFQEPIKPYPSITAESAISMPIHPFTLTNNPTNFNAKMIWFFYGDGGMFIANCDAATDYTTADIRAGRMGSLAGMGVGETKKIGSNLPYTFLTGPRFNQAAINTTYYPIAWTRNTSTSPATAANITSSTDFKDAYFGARVGPKFVSYALGCVIYPRRIYNQYSGSRVNRSSVFTLNQQDIIFLPMEFCDGAGYRVGMIPGIQALDGRPYGIEGEPQRPFTMNINNKLHRGVLVRTSHAGSGSSGGGAGNPELDAVTFLDLTGPIR